MSDASELLKKAGGFKILTQRAIDRIESLLFSLRGRVFSRGLFNQTPQGDHLRFDEDGNLNLLEYVWVQGRQRTEWTTLLSGEKGKQRSFIQIDADGRTQREDFYDSESGNYGSIIYLSKEEPDPDTLVPPLRCSVEIVRNSSGSFFERGMFFAWNENLVVSYKNDAGGKTFEIRSVAGSRKKKGQAAVAGVVSETSGIYLTRLQLGKLLYTRYSDRLDEVWHMHLISKDGRFIFLNSLVNLCQLRETVRRTYSRDAKGNAVLNQYSGKDGPVTAIREISQYYADDTAAGAACVALFLFDLLLQHGFASLDILTTDDYSNFYMASRPKGNAIVATLTQPGELLPGVSDKGARALNVYSKAPKGKPNLFERYLVDSSGNAYKDRISYETEISATYSVRTDMIAYRAPLIGNLYGGDIRFGAETRVVLHQGQEKGGVFRHSLQVAGKYSDALLQTAGSIVAQAILWEVSYLDCIQSTHFTRALKKEFQQRRDANISGAWGSIVEAWTDRAHTANANDRNIINVKHELVGMGHPVLGGILEGGLCFARFEQIAIGGAFSGLANLTRGSRIFQGVLISFGVFMTGKGTVETVESGVKLYQAVLSKDGRKIANATSRFTANSCNIFLGLLCSRMAGKGGVCNKSRLRSRWKRVSKRLEKRSKTINGTDSKGSRFYEAGKKRKVELEDLFASDIDEVRLQFNTETIHPQMKADCVLQSMFHNPRLGLKSRMSYVDFVKGVRRFLGNHAIGSEVGLSPDEMRKLYAALGFKTTPSMAVRTGKFMQNLDTVIMKEGGSVPFVVKVGEQSHAVTLEGWYIKRGKKFYMVRDALSHTSGGAGYSAYRPQELKKIASHLFTLERQAGWSGKMDTFGNSYLPSAANRGGTRSSLFKKRTGTAGNSVAPGKRGKSLASPDELPHRIGGLQSGSARLDSDVVDVIAKARAIAKSRTAREIPRAVKEGIPIDCGIAADSVVKSLDKKGFIKAELSAFDAASPGPGQYRVYENWQEVSGSFIHKFVRVNIKGNMYIIDHAASQYVKKARLGSIDKFRFKKPLKTGIFTEDEWQAWSNLVAKGKNRIDRKR